MEMVMEAVCFVLAMALAIAVVLVVLFYSLFRLNEKWSDEWSEKAINRGRELIAALGEIKDLREKVEDLQVLLAATDENLKRAYAQRDNWKSSFEEIGKPYLDLQAERDEIKAKLDKRSAALYAISCGMAGSMEVINDAFGLQKCNSPDHNGCLGCPGECEYTTNEA